MLHTKGMSEAEDVQMCLGEGFVFFSTTSSLFFLTLDSALVLSADSFTMLPARRWFTHLAQCLRAAHSYGELRRKHSAIRQLCVFSLEHRQHGVQKCSCTCQDVRLGDSFVSPGAYPCAPSSQKVSTGSVVAQHHGDPLRKRADRDHVV